jgi:hypothetical protein
LVNHFAFFAAGYVAHRLSHNLQNASMYRG